MLNRTYLSVKAPRPQQGTVQDVSPVGGCDDNDAGVALKAVHLRQQLIQRLLALIIASAHASSTGAAHGIDLIHEDNAGSILLGLQ